MAAQYSLSPPASSFHTSTMAMQRAQPTWRAGEGVRGEERGRNWGVTMDGHGLKFLLLHHAGCENDTRFHLLSCYEKYTRLQLLS